MRSEQGLSLVEATIILGVIALLSAVMAPSISAYVRDAQFAAARTDAEAIGTSLARMLTDVGEAWVVRNGAKGTASTADSHVSPSHVAGNRVDLLVTAGNTPALLATARPSGTDWDDPLDHLAIQSVENYLVTNLPSNTGVNAYRIATSFDSTAVKNFDPDGGGTYNAEHAWRGAYLTGPIGPDPWGNRYMVNVEFLARTQNTTGSGSVKDVFVLSAGQNGQTDTQFEVDGVTPGFDDVISLVSGGTR